MYISISSNLWAKFMQPHFPTLFCLHCLRNQLPSFFSSTAHTASEFEHSFCRLLPFVWFSSKKKKKNQTHWVSSAVDIPSADSWSPAYYIPCSTDIVVMRNANFLVTKCCSKAPIHQKEKKIKKENKPLICASPQACEKLTNLIILKFRIIKIRIHCSYLPGLLPWNAVNLCQLGWLRKQFKKNYKNMCTSETVDHSVIHSMQSWN